ARGCSPAGAGRAGCAGRDRAWWPWGLLALRRYGTACARPDGRAQGRGSGDVSLAECGRERDHAADDDRAGKSVVGVRERGVAKPGEVARPGTLVVPRRAAHDRGWRLRRPPPV